MITQEFVHLLDSLQFVCIDEDIWVSRDVKKIDLRCHQVAHADILQAISANLQHLKLELKISLCICCLTLHSAIFLLNDGDL